MADNMKTKELTQQFLKTPEMQECSVIALSIRNKLDPDDTVPVTIDVPKQFIRLIEFLEKKRAGDEGVTPRATDRVLTQILLNELHEQLHWLVVAPGHFGHYRDLWNKFCDAQGAPEEKIADPLAPEETPEGPF